MDFRRFWRLSRIATAVAVVGLALLLLIGYTSIKSSKLWVDITDDAARSAKIAQHLDEQLRILNEEETGLRGYLLTGDARFMQEKMTAPARFAQSISAMRGLAHDEPDQLRDADQLEALFADRIAWSANTLQIYAKQGPASAAQHLANGGGLALTNAMRTVLTGMKQRQSNAQLLLEKNAADIMHTARLVVPLGMGTTFFLFLSALFFLNRERTRTHNTQLERDRFFDASVDMLTIANFGGRIENVNPAWTHCLGWTAAELTSRPWLDFVHPDDHAATIAESLAIASDGKETHEFENRYLCKDGSWRWFSWSARAYSDTQHIYAVARDVTSSRQVLEQLRLLETCVAHLNDIVLITEAEPQAMPGPRIVYVNDAFQRRTGYSREEVIGQTPRILQGAKTQRDVLHRIGLAMRAWQPVHEELINYSKSGEEFWIELDIVPVADATGWFTHWIAIERDITARKASETRLQLAASVFTHTTDGITITDATGTILEANAAFEKITGYAREEVLGKNPRILKSGRQDAAFYADMWAKLLLQGHWHGEIWNRRKSGENYPELLNIVAVKNEEGEVLNYVAMFNDMSALRSSQALLDRITNQDPLTGLPNRTRLAERMAQFISNAQVSGKPVSMMMLTIDNFKGMNAALGHEAGDQLLLAFGVRLSLVVQQKHVLGRLPGEGFVVIMPDADGQAAIPVADKFAEICSTPFSIAGHELLTTSSIGIASYPADADNFQMLVGCCTSALVRAKSMGGNSYQLFNEAMHQKGLHTQILANELRQAIGHSQLTLYYQPLVDLKTGALAGMEALLRWRHPQLGTVSPAEFIPVAERSGLIKVIGSWVFRQACQDIRHWRDAGLAAPPVAINVSPVQFRGEDLVVEIKSHLTEFNIEPASIYVELTESALMEDVGSSAATLRALKKLGVKLSLDDFGTGYSSLSYLKSFPFDKVKIDQSFVRNILTNREDAVIASVVVSMAHGLGLTVIAEGVETEAQCGFLRDKMCDEIQGYLFAKPMPAPDMAALLRQDKRLPNHLLRAEVHARTILLVDDEPGVTSALTRLLRQDGYHILSAASGQEGLDVLAKHPVDIILADQRMPGMTGIEFLRTAKTLYPRTLRIVLSGYTELQSVTDAVNEGAVYRFLTKPWSDEQLRQFVAEAFQQKAMADENMHLSLNIQTTASELAMANRLELASPAQA